LTRNPTGHQPRSSTKSPKELLSLSEHKSKYVLKGYKVFFSTKVARQYEPIVYEGECMSGDPEALYYRILVNQNNEFCIQYFYYWQYQNCMMTSHGHDYEPIFIYLKNKNKKFDDFDKLDVYQIVNGGLGRPDCRFHKNEVRPIHGRRIGNTRHITSNLSPYPFYPFGKDGNVQYHACVSIYPLDTGKDLQFEEEFRPLFGIRACSNVFSGAQGDLHGHRFIPPLKRLTDRVLEKWYLNHFKNTDDMPFGHDIADPYTSPYIKFYKPSKEEIERLGKQRR
jgi:hypothetical protein